MNKKQIASLLCSEIASVQNPNDPRDTYIFPYIDELVEVFIKFLEFPCGEETIEDTGFKILDALSIFAMPQLELAKLPGALEDLSTGFETYLKKIAVIRYKGDVKRVKGDGVNYVGLLNTSLGGLLEGKVKKVNPRDHSVPNLDATIVTFSYAEENLRETIYNHARKFRNEVHLAPERSIFQTMYLFRNSMAAYLFATEENLKMIRKEVDPLYLYVCTIQEAFNKWSPQFVELVGQKREGALHTDWPDLQVFEWHDDEIDLVEDRIHYQDTDFDFDFESSLAPPRSFQGSVLDIADEQNRFWLIGEPGAGKTSSLRMLTWRRACELVTLGYLAKPCPIFISANQFSQSNSFRTIIENLLQIDSDELHECLATNKLWLLIDGVNEISSTQRIRADREIRHILNKYDEVSIVLSSRKFDFKSKFNIPVFELLPLSDTLIQNFLERNMTSSVQWRKFYAELEGFQSTLLELARNPLMLKMLIKVVDDGEIPANRGQLFRLFTKWIFSRERKSDQTDTLIKERLLAYIAFGMRSSGKVYATQPKVLKWIEEFLTRWHVEVNVGKLFNELLDNHILELDANGQVIFFHELVLEYFTAIELERLYSEDITLIEKYIKRGMWSESIIMLSGFLTNSEDLILAIYPVNKRLASRCIASGAKLSETTVSELVENAKIILSQEPKFKERIEAYIWLLEIATDEALSTVVKFSSQEKNQLILRKALLSCDKPESALLRLLEHGLETETQVYQSLSIFVDKPAKSDVINSPQMEQAEKFLLGDEIRSRSLYLINQIGISDNVKPIAYEKCHQIVETYRVEQTLWRAAITFSANQGFLEDFENVIETKISEIDQPHGGTYYSLFEYFVVRKELGLPLANDLILDLTRQCLRADMAGMAFKYINTFNLQSQIPFPEMVSQLQTLASKGNHKLLIAYAKSFDLDLQTQLPGTEMAGSFQAQASRGDIYSLMGYAEVYKDLDFEPFLDQAVQVNIAESNFESLRKYHTELKPNLRKHEEDLRDSIIKLFPRRKLKYIKDLIETFELEPVFSDIGMIERYLSGRGFGFINGIVNEESIYFEPSDVTNLETDEEPVPRTLVQYSSIQLSEHPKHKTAISVKILR